MGCLAWLLAVAGVGGGSLAFATAAPGQAWWVLGLVVAALLAGPHLLQWWLGRARRTERLAARWWAAEPGPVEVAFLCGGPDRVVDLVVADLVAEGRLALTADGNLTLTAHRDLAPTAGGDPTPTAHREPAPTADGNLTPPAHRDPTWTTDGGLTPTAGGGLAPTASGRDRTGRYSPAPEADFRREICNRLSHGDADVGALRFSTRSTAGMPPLWRSAVRQGLMLPAWRREYTPWYLAGAVVAVGYCVAVALGRVQRNPPGLTNLTFWVGIAALALGVVAVWRARFLVGYEFDPRTAAGLRAAELARAADRPGDRRHRVAVHGLRSAGDLRPGAPDPRPVPPSRWHVPWYARRVHEQDAPWWREVAQSTTDYAETLPEADGPPS